MKLTLSLVNADNSIAPEKRSKTWFDGGGSIGRFDGNDWVLSDPRSEISRVHAKVYFSNNTFFIEDLSTNGVFIQDRDNRMDQVPYALSDGDTLFIGHHQIKVCISGAVKKVDSLLATSSKTGQVGETGQAESVFASIDTLFGSSSLELKKPKGIASGDEFDTVSQHVPAVTPEFSAEPLIVESLGKSHAASENSEASVVGTVNPIPENWLDVPIDDLAPESSTASVTNNNTFSCHDISSFEGSRYAISPASNTPASDTPAINKLEEINEPSGVNELNLEKNDGQVLQSTLDSDWLHKHLSAQGVAVRAMFNALINELTLKKLQSLSTEEDKDALFQRLYESIFQLEYENKLKELDGCELKLIL